MRASVRPRLPGSRQVPRHDDGHYYRAVDLAGARQTRPLHRLAWPLCVRLYGRVCLAPARCRDMMTGITKVLWTWREPGKHRYTFTVRSLSAFAITDTELKLIASAAIIGESSSPKTGYSTPAAIGMPRML